MFYSPYGIMHVESACTAFVSIIVGPYSSSSSSINTVTLNSCNIIITLHDVFSVDRT